MDTWQALLNGNWANIVVASATAVLAFLTWLLWRETSKTRHYNQSAEIIISFEEHPRYNNAMNLVVENVGQGVARNLRLHLPDKHIIKLKGNEKELVLDELNLFKDEIPVFKSGQKIEHFSFMYFELADPSETNLKITATWKDYRGKKQKRASDVTASFYQGITSLGHDPQHEMAEAHKKFSKNFEQLLNGKRIKIETITSSELKEQNNKCAEEMQERRKAKAEASVE